MLNSFDHSHILKGPQHLRMTLVTVYSVGHNPTVGFHVAGPDVVDGAVAADVLMIVFLEGLSMSNMLNSAEQVQIQKYKTHAYETHKTACIRTIMLKHPTKQ